MDTATPSKPGRALPTLGPIQLRKKLQIPEWQFRRALTMGLIPAASADQRWPLAAVENLDGAAIAAQAGSIPDCGAHLAGQHLTNRLGVDIPGHAVHELHRLGLIPTAGTFEGHTMYCGRTIEAFTDVDAAVRAAHTGFMATGDMACQFLQIRASDLQWLLRRGLLTAARWGNSGYRGIDDVALYRVGDLEDLLADPAIDWTAVRNVRPGGRSALAVTQPREETPA